MTSKNILDIPGEVMFKIFKNLYPKEQGRFAMTNKKITNKLNTSPKTFLKERKQIQEDLDNHLKLIFNYYQDNYGEPLIIQRADQSIMQLDYLEEISKLLKLGANPYVQLELHYTPMSLMTDYGDIRILRELAKYADINRPDYDNTFPIMYAVANYDPIFLNFIIKELGANIEVRDRNGNTPLLITAIDNKIDLATTLIENGADPDVVNNEGKDFDTLSYEYGQNPYLTLEGLYKKVIRKKLRQLKQFTQQIVNYAKINKNTYRTVEPLLVSLKETYDEIKTDYRYYTYEESRNAILRINDIISNFETQNIKELIVNLF